MSKLRTQRTVALAAIAFGLCLTACSPKASSVQSSLFSSPSGAEGILGGSPVDGEDIVADVTVKVVVNAGDYENVCSGTMIDSRYVLTAAHCASGEPSPQEIVLFNGEKIAVERVILHPQWARNPKADLVYDFAILKLRKKAPLWASLPLADEQLNENDLAEIAGYGALTQVTKSGEGNGFLHSLPVKIGPNPSPVEFLADEGQGVGACYGDSGGPLYVRLGASVTLWGVDSAEGPDSGSGAKCGTSEIYSNVQAVLPWVLKSIGRR